MTDLMGNHPDMVAQTMQDSAGNDDQTSNHWEVAKFEKLLSQEMAAIDPASSNDIAAGPSLDKLFEELAKIDNHKTSMMKNLTEMTDKAVGNSDRAIGEDIGMGRENVSSDMEGRELFANQLDENLRNMASVFKTLAQYRGVLLKNRWIKEIAMTSVKNVKRTITQQG